MNYLQLTIGGQERGLKFNQKTYIDFYKYVDLEAFETTFTYAACYSALASNAYVKREEFSESFETVADWVDEMSVEDILQVKAAFTDTAYWKKLTEAGEKITENSEKKTKGEATMKNA